ncbi:MAG TPA: FHA domain-containing protein, partial [Vineibacter sp.]|nr:FHA domain-containing protein [Vineibacter sp.]
MPPPLRLRVHQAPLTETPPAPLLLVGGPVNIGRRDDNGWILPDATANVSRKHASVNERNGVWLVTDESANGTLHNGQLVGKGNTRPLAAGDMIKIGDYEILVEVAPDTGGPPPMVGMAPAAAPMADPYGVADLARADFGAAPPPPSGPSPFDPPPAERLAEAPRAVDLFGEFGAHQVAPGVGVRGGGEAPVAAFGGLDAAIDPGAGPGASPFGGSGGRADSPFGAPAVGGDVWGTPAPNPAPNAGVLVNDPLSNPGGGSVFGDQFGSADAIRNPLAGPGRADGNTPAAFGSDGNPFGAADPVGFGRDQPPAPLGYDAIAVPEIGGPGARSALPSDWNANPASGPAPPPPDLDPIEQALAGLKPAGAPAGAGPAPGPAGGAPMFATPQPAPAARPRGLGASPAGAAMFGAPGMAPAGAPRPQPPHGLPPGSFTLPADAASAAPQGGPALPPAADFFGGAGGPAPAMDDAFAHPSVPVPAAPSPAKPGTPVGAPSGPAA